MPLETYTYFVIILSGFGLVWSFRKGSGSHQKRIMDFEYLGFSAFWGVVSFGFWQFLFSHDHKLDEFNKFLQNPFTVGVSFFLLSLLFGWIGGFLFKKGKSAIFKYRNKKTVPKIDLD